MKNIVNGMSQGLEDRLLTSQELADWLNVTVQWVRDHTTRIEPIVPHIKIGKNVRFRRADVARFLRQQFQTAPTWERSSTKR